MQPSFANLLHEYRQRSRDPQSGGPLTHRRLAQALSQQNGYKVSQGDVKGWEAGASPPGKQRDLLLSLVAVLLEYGGLEHKQEADDLLVSAGYEPLEEAEFIRLRSGLISEDVSQMRVKSAAASIAGEARLQAEGSVVEGDLDISAEDVIDVHDEMADVEVSEEEPPAPGPEAPEQIVEFQRNGALVRVALTERGWRLPLDGLVVASDLEYGKDSVITTLGPEGEFYRALLDDLESVVSKELGDWLADNLPGEAVQYDAPAALRLPPELGRRVFPSARVEEPWLVLATLRDAEGQGSLEHIGAFTASLVELAREKGISDLILPLLGSGGMKIAPRAVAMEMLDALLWGTRLEAGQTITLVTIVPEVIAMAQRKLNLWLSNRAQALYNDEPAARDLLGISAEVYALGETLLQRDVTPPLAVGIMGGWGSGKSTVMRLMQQCMTGIRLKPVAKGYADDQGEGEAPSYVGHIYQIRFNAWTYAKSNLWASLMQTVFFELNRQISLEKQLKEKFPPLKGGPAYQVLYEENAQVDANALWDVLRDRQEAQLQALQEVEKAIADWKADREQAQDQRQQAVMQELGEEGRQVAVGVLQQKVRAVLGGFYPAAVRQLLQDKTLDQGEVEELFDEMRSLRTTLAKIWQGVRTGGWMTASLVLFGALTLAGAYLITTFENLPLWGEAAAWIASVLPWVLPILRTARQWAQWVDARQVEHQAMAEVEREKWQALRAERLARRRAEDERAVKAIQAREDLSPVQVDTQLRALAANGNLAAYEHYLAQMEAQAEVLRRQVGPTASYASLIDFVQSRLDEAAYEKELGLMHQIKLDIDRLTDGLIIQPWDDEATVSVKKSEFPRGTPRVVLYIDDLDRCPPPRVVEVMEAVQLLLNTRLFVVVLGLDTRYVTRALEKEYKDILQHEGDPSGLDYIEKILQIPYRVRPIEPAGLATFLEAQMEFVEEEAQEVTSPDRPPATPVLEGEVEAEESGEAEQAIEGEGQLSQRPEEGHVTLEDLPPEIVRFQREDYLDLTACCRQMSLTPRSVRRLVNVLKLVKIFWFRSLGHDRPRPVKQTVMGLLALSAAYPEVMREAFAQLETRFRDPQAVRQLKVIDFLREFAGGEGLSEAISWQVKRFRSDIEALQEVVLQKDAPPVRVGSVTLEDLTLSTFNLVRSFSFVGDPSYTVGEASEQDTLADR